LPAGRPQEATRAAAKRITTFNHRIENQPSGSPFEGIALSRSPFGSPPLRIPPFKGGGGGMFPKGVAVKWKKHPP
jgi:hypothetical protein